MQQAPHPIGIELTSLVLVVLVLLFGCLIALAPLRRLRLPFTVAIMLLGGIVGIAVQNLEQRGYGQSGVSVTHQETVMPPGGASDNPETGGYREHFQEEQEETQTSLGRRLVDEFVMVFRAAGDGLSPQLILFIFLLNPFSLNNGHLTTHSSCFDSPAHVTLSTEKL